MLIRLPEATYDCAGGIVRTEEACSVQTAARLLAEAQAVLEAAHARAEAEAAAIVKAAHDEAAELLQVAAQQAREEAAQAVDRCRMEAVHEWHRRHADLLCAHADKARENERQLANVVMQAVRRIVDTLPPQAMYVRALASVQPLLRGSETVTLHVAEADQPAAEAAVQGWQQQEDRPFELSVRVDATLTPGACVFQSPLGTLDTSLNVQFAGLAAALDRAVSRALGAAQKEQEQESGHADVATA